MGQNREFFVNATWDPEANVWFVADSNVPGLCAEADTQELLVEKLRVIIPELLELNCSAEARSVHPTTFSLHTERTESLRYA